MKTKKDIVKDVIELIKNQGRAVNEGTCVYLTEDDKRCGHSMAVQDDYLEKILELDPADASATHVIGLFGDELHKEKYRGFSVDFWEGIQRLHDVPKFWDEDRNPTKAAKRHIRKIVKL